MPHPNIDSAISLLPTALQAPLQALLLTPDFHGVIQSRDVQRLAQTFDVSIEQLALLLLPMARLYAIAPISDFYVGAVAIGDSGSLYFGANAEFENHPLNSTVHAEQAAVMNAWICGEQGLSAVAVSGIPCGHCRQFMNELVSASSLEVLRPNENPLLLSTLLPNAFGPQSLGNSGGLMESVDHQLHFNHLPSLNPHTKQTLLAALAMANRSYAPYSGNYAGVALMTTDGHIFGAPYAENAAFNPSLSPLQSALFQIHLAGMTPSAIRTAALVEAGDTLCRQVDATRQLLQSVTDIELLVVPAKN
ncbi:cytidine deaminase [Chloroflexi bacterium TSY]|nr:cytidine deaminase [Chloroflexi bacterium TSY]